MWRGECFWLEKHAEKKQKGMLEQGLIPPPLQDQTG